jgi:hypothetical protein
MIISDSIKLVLDMSLGDGGVYFGVNSRVAHYSCTHSIKQIDYALYKAMLLEQAGYSVSGKIRTWPNGKQGYGLATKSHPNMSFVHMLLYDGTKKVFRKELFNHLDERSLAFFFMDDGFAETRYRMKLKYETRIYNPRVLSWYGFSRYCFTDEEQHYFMDWLYTKYNIHSQIQKKTNGNVVVIYKKEDKDTFRTLINPYIIDSMKYKISFPHSFGESSYISIQNN